MTQSEEWAGQHTLSGLCVLSRCRLRHECRGGPDLGELTVQLERSSVCLLVNSSSGPPRRCLPRGQGPCLAFPVVSLVSDT